MEHRLHLQDPIDTCSRNPVDEQRRTPYGPLQTGEIMSREVVTVTSAETIALAAKTMSEHNISCVVVVDDGQVAGILTEKDVLKGVAGRDVDFRRLKVSQRMSSPVEVVGPDLPVLEAGRMMSARRIRRLPVVQEGQLLGIITETDITRGLVSQNPLRYISDIMTPHVMTVDADARVDEAARIMSRENISCLIARHRQEIAGIITEKDVLRRVVALHKDPTQTYVVEIMSFPVVAVPPAYSVLSASRKMETMHVHRLIVMDDKGLYGVVTQTDILRAIRTACEIVESQRRELAGQFADLMQDVIQGLGKVQQFLDQFQNPRTGGTPPTPTPGQPAKQADAGALCIL